MLNTLFSDCSILSIWENGSIQSKGFSLRIANTEVRQVLKSENDTIIDCGELLDVEKKENERDIFDTVINLIHFIWK